ncbi:hypothetical protein F5J12DRAFT_359025 [Pisolithus orientalis]|uniref:uncharacterized protein n=1 Tax=Pisolithus orientalis TaxID=936130 RepID=UPI0022242ED5|nr:uncharacterized protein F5J12DRAFT_359025 [Pisolithus orientalis]KAI5996523.1 hypothetical protein F5J12DRAFT_359025 [Pisolithus orientalis]
MWCSKSAQWSNKNIQTQLIWPRWINIHGGRCATLPSGEWVEEITKFAILSHTWEADEVLTNPVVAELDESIRSMFTWYRNAHVCIVYVGQAQSLLDLATNHWFTQERTLQELLAPSRLKFYNRTGICLLTSRTTR